MELSTVNVTSFSSGQRVGLFLAGALVFLCGCQAVAPANKAPATSQPAIIVVEERQAQQAVVAFQEGAQTIWNDVRPWLLATVAIVLVLAAAAVVVVLFWISRHSYIRQKPEWEALRRKRG